jgi:proteasome lid subunit RPN8/RPN11
MAKTEYLIIPLKILKEIVTHIKKELPNEAVGLLAGGIVGKVDKFIPMKNLAGSKNYLVDPYEQFNAYKKIERSKKKIIGIIHSHPDGGTDMSESDIFFARQLKLVQLVISLSQPVDTRVSLAAYDFSAKNFIEIPVYTDAELKHKISRAIVVI